MAAFAAGVQRAHRDVWLFLPGHDATACGSGAAGGLQCIAPGMTAADLYRGWFYHNGALRLGSTLGWGLQMLKADALRRNLREASDGLQKAWSDLRQPLFTPYGAHPQLQHAGLPTYVRDWIHHTQPGAYWEQHDVSAIPLPVSLCRRCISLVGSILIWAARSTVLLRSQTMLIPRHAIINIWWRALGAYSLGRVDR